MISPRHKLRDVDHRFDAKYLRIRFPNLALQKCDLYWFPSRSCSLQKCDGNPGYYGTLAQTLSLCDQQRAHAANPWVARHEADLWLFELVQKRTLTNRDKNMVLTIPSICSYFENADIVCFHHVNSKRTIVWGNWEYPTNGCIINCMFSSISWRTKWMAVCHYFRMTKCMCHAERNILSPQVLPC